MVVQGKGKGADRLSSAVRGRVFTRRKAGSPAFGKDMREGQQRKKGGGSGCSGGGGGGEGREGPCHCPEALSAPSPAGVG